MGTLETLLLHLRMQLAATQVTQSMQHARYAKSACCLSITAALEYVSSTLYSGAC